MREKEDDGMQHTYSTCPRCKTIASTENIVFVDGQQMCRQCLRGLQQGKSSHRGEES